VLAALGCFKAENIDKLTHQTILTNRGKQSIDIQVHLYNAHLSVIVKIFQKKQISMKLQVILAKETVVTKSSRC